MITKNLKQFIIKQSGSSDFDKTIWAGIVKRLQQATVKAIPDITENSESFMRNMGPSLYNAEGMFGYLPTTTRGMNTNRNLLSNIGSQEIVSSYLGKKILLKALKKKLQPQRDTYSSMGKFDKWVVDRLWGPQEDMQELFNAIDVIAPPAIPGKGTLEGFRNNQAPHFIGGITPDWSTAFYNLEDKATGTSPAHYQPYADIISLAPDAMSTPAILAHEYAHGINEDSEVSHDDDIHENISDATPGLLRLRRKLFREGKMDDYFSEIPEKELLTWLDEDLSDSNMTEDSGVLLPKVFEHWVEDITDSDAIESKKYPDHVILNRNEYRELIAKLYRRSSPDIQKFMRQLVIKGIPRQTKKPFWSTLVESFKNPSHTRGGRYSAYGIPL